MHHFVQVEGGDMWKLVVSPLLALLESTSQFFVAVTVAVNKNILGVKIPLRAMQISFFGEGL
jgi:hypothetical protein